MANRSARTIRSCSSDVSAGLVASLRISDRCCSSSSLVRHSIHPPASDNKVDTLAVHLEFSDLRSVLRGASWMMSGCHLVLHEFRMAIHRLSQL
jgi:hypothetical protein